MARRFARFALYIDAVGEEADDLGYVETAPCGALRVMTLVAGFGLAHGGHVRSTR